MKIVDLTDEKPEREPVAAAIQDYEAVALLLRYGNTDSCYKLYYDNSGGREYKWSEEITENKVLKFYYPGDRITIEV